MSMVEKESIRISVSSDLTIRADFAARALQGILSSPFGYQTLEQAAADAVKAADLLIAELNK